MDKYTELEKEAQKFLDETDTMQFSMVELLTMFYRHNQQLTLTDVSTRELPPWVRPLITIITMSLVTVYLIYKTFYVC